MRGGAPVTEEILVTPRGPIITPLLDGIPVQLSMRATWLEPVPVRGLIDVHRAGSWDEFRAAFRHWPGPSLNVAYADADGHIGWQLIGTMPRRRGSNGTLPMPAWDPAVGWESEHLPFEAMPSVLDPPGGYVATANHAAWADAPDHPFLGDDWLDGYRAARILEVLGSRDRWTVADAAELQRDVTAMPWREVRDLVLRAPVGAASDDVRAARALLADWDGRVSADSAAAAVYEALMGELAVAFARATAPASWSHVIGAGVGDVLPRTSLGATTASRVVRWLRDHPSPDAVIVPALGAAFARVRTAAGPLPEQWRWGDMRPLRLLHPLGVRAPLDRMLNVGPLPLGGDTNTVAQAGVRPTDPFRNPAAIPNHRTVIDLGDLEASRYVLAGGQSGNPLSPHYADQLRLWARGDAVPIAWSPAAVEAATVDRLVLDPRGHRGAGGSREAGA